MNLDYDNSGYFLLKIYNFNRYDTTPRDVTNIYPDGKPTSRESKIED